MSQTLLQPTESSANPIVAIRPPDPTSNSVDNRCLDFDGQRYPPFPQGFWGIRNAASEHGPPTVERDAIEDLPEAGYRVLRPIPYEIKKVGTEDFKASFREANISISGSDMDDAYQALVAAILDTFDVLIQEQKLGPDADRQFRILRTYIART